MICEEEKKMNMLLPAAWLLLLQMLGLSAAMAMAASAAQRINALPGCKQKCGDVTIPYPFGIGEGCFLEEGFNITCNASSSPPTPLLGETNIDVVEIQLSQGLVVVNQYVAYDCYDKVGNSTRWNKPYLDLTDMPYKLSDSRNKFVAVGCDTVGYIYDDYSGFETGCLLPNGTCSGIGCCEVSIPKGLRYFEILIDSSYNHTNCSDFNPCSYAFLTDAQGWFNFSLDSFCW